MAGATAEIKHFGRFSLHDTAQFAQVVALRMGGAAQIGRCCGAELSVYLIVMGCHVSSVVKPHHSFSFILVQGHNLY
jgi:hypothetical protein